MPTNPIIETFNNAPPLEPQTCPNPHTKFGHHEEYLDHANFRLYCQNCGAESYVPGHEPVKPHTVRRALPTFEEVYEVIGCVVIPRE